MNNQKRKELNKAIELLEQAQNIIGAVKEEEQEGFDNLSEGIQQSMRGESMEEAIGNMESAIDSIDEAISAVEEASI